MIINNLIMMKKILNITAYLLLSYFSYSQSDINNICNLIEGKITFKLNKNWTGNQLSEVSKTYNLDSVLLSLALKSDNNILYDSILWHIRKISSDIIELSKDFQKNSYSAISKDDLNYILFSTIPSVVDIEQNPAFGINDFKSKNTFRYSNGEAFFRIANFKNSKKIIFSGSFNNWSTSQDEMTKTDTGWIINLPLKPGKHTYKLIVDGKWQTDPGNKIKENDNDGNTNSVVYCPNYTFSLKGFENSKKVFLSGSFNDWSPSTLPMIKYPSGWKIDLFLNEGTHFYKFIVDDNWITDPENPRIKSDADGNQNSYIEIGEKYHFALNDFKDAQQVILTGSFNNWSENELLMNKTEYGWELDYAISDKMHEYKYIVDGKWIIDPSNKLISGSMDYFNSVLVPHPNYEFTLSGYQDAKQVILSGSFNNWNPNGFNMIKKNDVWTFPVQLKSGKHLYKYIIDGKWIVDPQNEIWEENAEGTGNSVLWIDFKK